LAKHDENYMPPDAAYALKKGKEATAVNQAIGATVTGATENKGTK
jgi:cytochrome c-type biogenesis protein CcmE